jgi:hypothetical protein
MLNNGIKGLKNLDKFLKALLPKTDEEKKIIWDNALFVPDANILLNLYKYTEETRTEFIIIMRSVKDKLWIPHQVALEFLHNRSSKIQEQVTDYENHLKALAQAKDAAKKELDKTLNGIKKPFRRMDLDNVKKEIDDFFDDVMKKVQKKNEKAPSFHEKILCWITF